RSHSNGVRPLPRQIFPHRFRGDRGSLQDLGQTTVVLLGNEMERKGRQHCVKSAGIGFDPSTLGSILGKNRSIWFSNRRIIYTLYKGPTPSKRIWLRSSPTAAPSSSRPRASSTPLSAMPIPVKEASSNALVTNR